MTTTQSWGSIPLEIRLRAQWAYTDPNDKDISKRKAPRNRSGGLLEWKSITECMTFDEACFYARKVGGSVGYILSKDDPYTVIDLDVKDATNEADPRKWTTQEDFDRYWRIVQAFDSYTESSQGGKGLHIWLHGNIGEGCRRDGVEVYSQERFIITTGAIVVPNAIKDGGDKLQAMVGDIRRVQKQNRIELVEVDEELEDWELVERAMNAHNGEKFTALCNATSCTGRDDKKVHGSYAELGFPTQSEADLALMSMFAFYSKSNAQCKRLFRMSGLGKREKATANDRYLNKTLEIIRGRQKIEEGANVNLDDQVDALIAKVNAGPQNRERTLLHVPGTGEPTPALPPVSATIAAMAPVVAAPADTLAWPPGLTGQIAYYIYQSAPRPVREVAIVAALGLIAGICGKAFNIHQSGLNLYIVLVARSAIGKEAMHSGIASIMNAIAMRNPTIMKFVDFTEFASGQALQKAVNSNSSFVNVQGEFGHRLKRMASENETNGPMQTLRTVMTNLYQKSGQNSIVGGIGYSNSEGNIASASGVAYSMIGETTPGRFYASLTSTMMEDGFLSRFNVVEYDGPRPQLNANPVMEPTKALADALSELLAYVTNLLNGIQRVKVDRTESAARKIHDFEIECDNAINATNDESYRQMYNRASLKMMRVAALLAAATNWYKPIIDDEHVDWALDLVRRDIASMKRRLESGDIGGDDSSRIKKMVSCIQEYMVNDLSPSNRGFAAMRKDNVIPKRYITLRLTAHPLFASTKVGAASALNSAIQVLIESGNLVELDKGKCAEKYKFSGKCYRIVNLTFQDPS